MDFKKYQHIERLGTDATDGILNGIVHVFPKIDGSNASVWLDDLGRIQIGMRTRQLADYETYHGLRSYIEHHSGLINYLYKYRNRRIYGEWLIRHKIKTYKPEAWHKFYVFDVMVGNEYIPYEEYYDELRCHDVEVIPTIATLKDPSELEINDLLDECTYLMQDNQPGEGLVIKNYEFVNKFGEITWAKVVRSKPQQAKAPHNVIIRDNAIEPAIVSKFITPEFVAKEYAKIAVDGWQSKYIGKFLQVVWKTFLDEEIYNVTKKFHNPKIDFRLLNKLVVEKVKELQPQIF